jgi:hypothetical protein
VNLNRHHIDRVTDYLGTLPERNDSGMPWFNPNSDYSRLLEALCLAANLHDPDLITALTKTRTVTASADDLDRIAGRDRVDGPTAQSMRRVARMLRAYTA